MLFISAFRLIGRGHAQRVLRRNRGPYHQRYDSVIGDQRERLNSLLHKIKYEKDDAARALHGVNCQIADLFTFEEAKKLLGSHRESDTDKGARTMESRGEINDAYRLHRLLRPDAPNFFEEQSFISMKQRMDKVIQDHQTECPTALVPSDMSLDIAALEALDDPGVSDDSYALAIYSLMASLHDDVVHACGLLSIESKGDPFEDMLDFIRLKRDGSNVNHWVNSVWPKLQPLLTGEFSVVSSKDMEEWLSSHLERVNHNREALNKPNTSEWYDIKRDLPYDGVPYPETLLDERKLGYPLDKAPHYLMSMLKLFNETVVGGVTKEALEELIEVLRKLGLKDWFGLQKTEILSTFFGGSFDETFCSFPIGLHEITLTTNSPSSCEKVLKIFLEGREDELDPRSLTPASILRSLELKRHGTVASSKNPLLSQETIRRIIQDYLKKIGHANATKVVRDYNTAFDRMIEEELKFHSSVGAGTLTENGIEYNTPAGAQFDAKRNYYVRTKEGVDPTLKLENLRSCVLERRRMRTMTKEGRVYFLRVVVAVGDGKGYFGTGVGFGNDVATARGSAVQQALRNMYFIDFDPKEPLTTPVLGREYGSKVYITPRKMGSGIKTNRKYLPLVYLTGLDNCKVTFHGRSSWLTRSKALRKALEQIYSRRTMCNATGTKYVYMDKPGDHTVHWPDRWFIPISKEYKDKIAALKNLKRMRFPRHTNRIVMPEEVKPEIPRYARHRFRSPLELREHDRKREQCKNRVKEMPLAEKEIDVELPE